MKDYLTHIDEKFPIRRTDEEKSKFLDFAIAEGKEIGYEGQVETVEKHNNLVFGNLDNAKVIFTAHYDTPASSLFPNLMMPRNLFLGYLYAFCYPLLLAFLSLGVAYLITSPFSFGEKQLSVMLVVYLVLYLTAFYLATRCFKNKRNLNDNTSGVATVFALMSEYKDKDVAFVLFDNEEKGLLGSKAFAKKHKELLKNKLIINFDCVGNGEHIIFVAKKGAENHALYPFFRETKIESEKYQTHFYPMKGSMGNSDYKRFENGVGVMACKKGKVGFYTARIHTNRDNVASWENISYITQHTCAFLNKIK
jgi:hypothetical protein